MRQGDDNDVVGQKHAAAPLGALTVDEGLNVYYPSATMPSKSGCPSHGNNDDHDGSCSDFPEASSRELGDDRHSSYKRGRLLLVVKASN